MSNEALVVLVTAPTMVEAERIGKAVVTERLAACVNLVPGVRSIYRWQDAIQDDTEILLLIKTSSSLLNELTNRIVELHSYETPEVLALPGVGGSAMYLQWLFAQVGAEEKSNAR
jgi:periplasmic divalent cation tolerance protein